MFKLLKKPLKNTLKDKLTCAASAFDKSKYNFYCDFKEGIAPTDLVSGEKMSITGLAAGRVGYDGATFGINEPVIEKDGLLCYGAYTQRLLNSENLKLDFDASLLPSDPVYADPKGGYSANAIELTSGTQYCYGLFTVTEDTEYVFSQWVRLGTSSSLSYAIYDQTNAAWIVSSSTYTDMSEEFSREAVSFRTPVGCTYICIYPKRYINPSDLGTTYHFGANLTNKEYLLPYVKSEGASVAVPSNYSTPTYGYRWDLDNLPGLVTALEGEVAGTAKGSLRVLWKPMFDYTQLSTTASEMLSSGHSFLFS